MSPQKTAAPAPAAVESRDFPKNAPQGTAKRGEMRPHAPQGPQKPAPAVDGPALIAELHAHFCKWSRVEVRLRPGGDRLWWDLYVDRGRDAEALKEEIKVVCLYLREQIGRDKRNPGALKLANLLQPDQFEADLGEAKMMCGKGTGAARRGDTGKRGRGDDAPPGWRAFLEDQYPDHAPAYRDQSFSVLPGPLQQACREGCR